MEFKLGTLDDILNYAAPPQSQIVKIEALMPTPKSDRLTSCQVFGWTIITSNINQSLESFGESRYKVGDQAVYIAIDSVLPEKLNDFLFPPESKIKLDSNRRVRTLKLRDSISQGLLVGIDELSSLYPELKTKKLGDDVSKILEITKFEPPASSVPENMRGDQVSKKNRYFREYPDIKNIKWYSELGVFEPGELVYISVKIHGTSIRASMSPFEPRNLWQKLLKFFKLLPSHEYCIGSRRVQLHDKPKDYKGGFYDKNVYRLAGEKFKFRDILKPGEQLFGELVFVGCQKNYTYGAKPGEYLFFAYDVMKDGKFLDPEDFKTWCDERKVTRVPDLGYVPFNMDELMKLASAKTCFGGQKIREGVVVKPTKEKIHPACGRLALKLINPEYLLKESNTDFH